MHVFTHRPAPDSSLPVVVSTEEACAWVKTGADDVEAAALAVAATAWAEEHCQQPLFSRNFTVTLKGFESGTFDSLFVTAIVSVKYRVKGSNTLVDATAVTHYELYDNQIIFTDAAFDIEDVEHVVITFTAGFPTGEVPEVIRLAIRLFLADNYDNRADSKRIAPSAAENLLSNYRLPKI